MKQWDELFVDVVNELNPAAKVAAKAELDFLKSLLPKDNGND